MYKEQNIDIVSLRHACMTKNELTVSVSYKSSLVYTSESLVATVAWAVV